MGWTIKHYHDPDFKVIPPHRIDVRIVRFLWNKHRAEVIVFAYDEEGNLHENMVYHKEDFRTRWGAKRWAKKLLKKTWWEDGMDVVSLQKDDN